MLQKNVSLCNHIIISTCRIKCGNTCIWVLLDHLIEQFEAVFSGSGEVVI